MITNCEVGNTYGGLHIKEEDGKFFWSVEDYNGHDWQEISEQTYNAIKAEVTPNDSNVGHS